MENLEEQLENFENVRYRMKDEGFHYCFKQYSSFIGVEDEEFHRLRKAYLEISEKLENYVNDRINELNEKINDDRKN
jgi:hypothetical protein